MNKFLLKNKKSKEHRTNGEITSSTVRVVGDDIESQVVSIFEARKMAEDAELDLVEIVPNSNPPVCKIVDYNKFLYENKKKKKEIEQNSKKSALKEIKMSPNIGDHDFNFKLKHATDFLHNGDKVKLSVFFKGRTIVYKEQGEMVLLKFAQNLLEIGKAESLPKLEGKNMSMIISPKKK
jgi:translation initiation factor IF-3